MSAPAQPTISTAAERQKCNICGLGDKDGSTHLGQPQLDRLGLWLGVALVGLSMFVAAWAGVEFTRSSGRIAAIWVANAILIVALLRSRPQQWPVLFAAGYLANVLADLVVGDPPLPAVLMPLCNMLEAAVCAGAFALDQKIVDFNKRSTIFKFTLFAAGPACLISAIAAALLLTVLTDVDVLSVAETWYGAHALGLVTIVPILMTFDWRDLKRLRSRASILPLASLTGVLLVVFCQSSFPLLFLVVPILVYTASELGLAGTTIGVPLTAVIALLATRHGLGPLALMYAGDGGVLADAPNRQQIEILQLFIAVTSLTSISVAALIKERTLFAAALDQASDFHYIKNVAGEFVSVNQAVAAHHGFARPADILGKTDFDLTSPERAEALFAAEQEMMRTGTPIKGVEEKVVDPSGVVRWYKTTKIPLRDQAGRPIGLAGTTHDITTEKHLEEALTHAKAFAERAARDSKISADLLFTTLEAMDQGIMVIEPDGSMPVLNRRTLRMLDFPSEMAVARPSYGALVAFQRARGDFAYMAEEVRANIENPFADRTVRFEGKQKNGSVIETRSAPLADGGIVRTFTDITARREAEAALEAREHLYRLLTENSNDIIVKLSLDGRRLYVSPACRAILGYSSEDMLTMARSELLHVEDCDLYDDAIRQVAEGRAETAITTVRLKAAGRGYIHMEANLRLVRNEAGEPQEIIGVYRDVTQREKARLEAEEAKRRAEHANEAKSAFLAAMSHEVRTPLNSIIGFTDILLDEDGLDPEVRARIERINSAGQMLLTVVNDVLDFSKVEAGEIVLDPQVFNIQQLVDEVTSIAGDAAAKKGLTLAARIEPAIPPHLLGDGPRLRQVILNLVNNAIKFTEAGSVTVHVSTPGEAAGEEVGLLVAVVDTGMGIRKDKQPALFKRFSQIDNTISRRFGGTGLGLAICKMLVELMGGEIGVDSDEGEGATFWFSVTLRRAAKPEIKAEIPAHALTRPSRILLADDLPLNCEIAKKLLAKGGHFIEAVHNGQDAVEAARTGDFDLILMDIQMPGVDGIAATRLIRQLPGKVARIPIVAMTANVLPAQVAEFLAAGMNGHVGKPIKPAQLYKTVAQALAASVAAVADRGTAERDIAVSGTG